MKRIDENNISLTNEELLDIRELIREHLDMRWDHYTDTFVIEKTSWEDGMRSMNPKMYDMANKMTTI
jgi:hypothetical protein